MSTHHLPAQLKNKIKSCDKKVQRKVRSGGGERPRQVQPGNCSPIESQATKLSPPPGPGLQENVISLIYPAMKTVIRLQC